MLPEKHRWISVEFRPEGDARRVFNIARELEDAGNLEGAATAYDRAYALDPAASDISPARTALLDRLEAVECGIRFRYIPAGVFLMGCDTGEDDEGPRHPVSLSAYWMSETPVSWAAYCRLMDWAPPPTGHPRQPEPTPGKFDQRLFHLHQANKIRLQYCEDHTTKARDWHSHAEGQMWQAGSNTAFSQELFGKPTRDNPEAPWTYEAKPMVAIAWQDAEDLAHRLSARDVQYSLPTEAQWEKAARGGLIGARYAWGNEPPARDRCDFGRLGEFSIAPMKAFPANGYGLYAVNGGVWEWTHDWYDRDYYRQSPETDPQGPATGEEKALRGGSWSDCADAVTVTFRMSRGSRSWTDEAWGGNLTPNIGFRLCRMVVA